MRIKVSVPGWLIAPPNGLGVLRWGSNVLAHRVPKGSRMRMDGTPQYSDSGNQDGEIHCRTMKITAGLRWHVFPSVRNDSRKRTWDNHGL
jgi:hypothetical protein